MFAISTNKRGKTRHAALHCKILRRLQPAVRPRRGLSDRALLLSGTAEFSYPEDGARYDVLLIIRGCTGCPYLYEEIDAAHRVVITAADEIAPAIREIERIASGT